MTFTMYDSVDISQLPADTQACSYYANGRYANLGALKARFPHLVPDHVLPVLVIPGQVPPLRDIAGYPRVEIDVENTDWTPDQAGQFCKEAIAQGATPYLYCSLSTAAAVARSCATAGLKRDQVKLHTAHWTGSPHVCSGIATGSAWGTINADATQYVSGITVNGQRLNCDASLCQDNYLVHATAPPPPPPPPPQHHASYTGTGELFIEVDLDHGKISGIPAPAGVKRPSWHGKGKLYGKVTLDSGRWQGIHPYTPLPGR